MGTTRPGAEVSGQVSRCLRRWPPPVRHQCGRLPVTGPRTRPGEAARCRATRTSGCSSDTAPAGRRSAALIDELLVPALGRAAPPGPLEDATTFTVDGADLALSTDAYVVNPLFFPAGTSAPLAVHGSVNNLAMRAATPVALTVAYVSPPLRGS